MLSVPSSEKQEVALLTGLNMALDAVPGRGLPAIGLFFETLSETKDENKSAGGGLPIMLLRRDESGDVE